MCAPASHTQTKKIRDHLLPIDLTNFECAVRTHQWIDISSYIWLGNFWHFALKGGGTPPFHEGFSAQEKCRSICLRKSSVMNKLEFPTLSGSLPFFFVFVKRRLLLYTTSIWAYKKNGTTAKSLKQLFGSWKWASLILHLQKFMRCTKKPPPPQQQQFIPHLSLKNTWLVGVVWIYLRMLFFMKFCFKSVRWFLGPTLEWVHAKWQYPFYGEALRRYSKWVPLHFNGMHI